ncbi:MAG: S1 RNA-binding domain-containing protein [bacterium]
MQEDQKEKLKKLLDNSPVKIPKKGDIVKGKIVNISNKEVNVDIENLTTGVIRGRELFNESEEYGKLQIGDEVEATVLEEENERGEMELSFRFAGQQKAWDGLREFLETGKIIEVVITDANKGGLMVRVQNIMGFLPVSQLSPEHYPRVQGGDRGKILEKLKRYVNQKFSVKVIDVNEKEEKVIVSEKIAWEETQKDVIDKYKVGDDVEGKVAAVTDFGVFIKFGDSEDLEGLIHISELAWQRIDNPSDIIEVGQTVKAQIINIQGSKIFLSIKKLIEDPWINVEKKYQIGQVVKGKILKINHFGFFVELDKDIHGLAHLSELAEKSDKKPTEIAKPGDIMDFTILTIEPKVHRLGLSLKGAKPKKKEEVKKVEEVADKKDVKKNEEVEGEKTEEKKEDI